MTLPNRDWLAMVIGTALSIALGAFFYFRVDLNDALAAFAGLLGVAISLQVELLLRSHRSEHEQRSGMSWSIDSDDLEWWFSASGLNYLRVHEDALSRGVNIRRVFIYRD